jgi:hypothetical protein
MHLYACRSASMVWYLCSAIYKQQNALPAPFSEPREQLSNKVKLYVVAPSFRWALHCR